MLKKYFNFFFLIVFTFSCSNEKLKLNEQNKKKIISIKGSDTVLPIIESEIASFKNEYPSISLSVVGGGTGDGIEALIQGNTDLAMASRDLKDKEKIIFNQKNKNITKKIIAHDALMIVVNPSNPISKLTREQIELIYTGKITNWSELGGLNIPIELYSRESTSGTYSYFQEVVLNDNAYSKNMLSTFVTEAIVKSVAISKGAIGYIGIGYKTNKIKALSVSFNGGKTFIKPSIETTKNKTYPISRPLFLMYEESNKEKVNEIIDFTLSEKGQNIISELGYIPLNN